MTPRVVAFVNGDLGADALAALKGTLVGAVLHPPACCRNETGLIAAMPVGVPVIRADDPALVDHLSALSPTHGISVLYGYILPADLLGNFPCGVANLHPSFLPYGRGAHPNAWAIAEGHPAGVSLHLVDAGVDTGPIIRREEVPVDPADDAGALYTRLLTVAGERMPIWFADFLAGRYTAELQAASTTPARRVSELDTILRVDPDRTYTGRQLIDLLRARTFTGHPGAPYLVDGRRLRLSLRIEEEPS